MPKKKRNSKANKTRKGNRKYKDSVFIGYLTEKPERLLSLYRALSDDNTATVDDIRINSIHTTFTQGTYNDISFTVGNKYIILLEHQSTINYNMPLRMLDYVNNLFLNEIPKRDLIYKKELITLPMPQFYVFYNGEAPFPKQTQLKLSDAFASNDARLELLVDVFNINYDENADILNKCQELREYSYLVHRIRHHQKNGKSLYDAIIIAIKDCLKNNIMSDYLSYHKSEVSEIMKLTWSHKGEIEYEREQAETRGIAIGEANGKILGVNLITKMNAWLSKSNRSDELTRSFEDSALQQKLLAEYQKTHQAATSIN